MTYFYPGIYKYPNIYFFYPASRVDRYHSFHFYSRCKAYTCRHGSLCGPLIINVIFIANLKLVLNSKIFKYSLYIVNNFVWFGGRDHLSDIEIEKQLKGYVIFFNYDKYFVCEDELYPLWSIWGYKKIMLYIDRHILLFWLVTKFTPTIFSLKYITYQHCTLYTCFILKNGFIKSQENLFVWCPAITWDVFQTHYCTC